VSEENGKITEKHRRVSAKSLANLKPWPKGYCPNPGGKPSGPTLLAEIRELLRGKGGKERKEAARAFVAQLKRGSIAHAKEIIDREDGPLAKELHLTGDVDVTLNLGAKNGDEPSEN
jgi:hypothetical protein